MRNPPLLLFICCVIQNTSAVWIVAQVKEINYEPQCIQDRNCESMEFSLIVNSQSSKGSTQSSWQLDNVLSNPENSQMFIYWSESLELTNITIKSVLTANDLLFNIQRRKWFTLTLNNSVLACDHSSPLHIFSPMTKVIVFVQRKIVFAD